MKNIYQAPELEIVRFTTEDILTGSAVTPPATPPAPPAPPAGSDPTIAPGGGSNPPAGPDLSVFGGN